MRIHWSTKLFIKFFPQTFLKFSARKQGIDPRKLDWADKLFADCQRIDIQPTSGGSRGFILTLDNKLTLWFFQDGDHFTFDGYEMGEYDSGEVTDFDQLR